MAPIVAPACSQDRQVSGGATRLIQGNRVEESLHPVKRGDSTAERSFETRPQSPRLVPASVSLTKLLDDAKLARGHLDPKRNLYTTPSSKIDKIHVDFATRSLCGSAAQTWE